jgi:hypothetical protein
VIDPPGQLNATRDGNAPTPAAFVRRRSETCRADGWRGDIEVRLRRHIGARENRPVRWRDIWSAGHSTSGVSEVLSVDDLVVRTMAEYRAASARVR